MDDSPQFQLKAISSDGIARALKKAERYRLLNEPWESESICRDVLEVEPENQEALIALVLSITDQFATDGGKRVAEARGLLGPLKGDYERAYYSGIICERRGTALLNGGARHGLMAYDWLRQAMDWYEKAETLRPPGNEDALLRWNTCARLIMRHPELRPAEAEPAESQLE